MRCKTEEWTKKAIIHFGPTDANSILACMYVHIQARVSLLLNDSEAYLSKQDLFMLVDD